MGYRVPILVFLGLSVLELFTLYATDRQTSDRETLEKASRNAPAYQGGGIVWYGIVEFNVPLDTV